MHILVGNCVCIGRKPIFFKEGHTLSEYQQPRNYQRLPTYRPVSIKRILLIIGCVILGVMILWALLDDEQNLIETTDIADYATDHHLTELFPDTIPENAEANYFYYNYYSEDEDEFLELTFSTDADLQAFLDETFADLDATKLRERNNPYDPRFTEYIYGKYASWIPAEGHFMRWEYRAMVGDEIWVYSHWHSLNVCPEERRAVITYSRGGEWHTPKYVEYFGVPLDENLKDVIWFD